MKPVTIITGGQYGSEAKGAIAGYLSWRDNYTHVVRTGATNAGHSVEYRDVVYAMQQLPVGWVNPDAQLILGAGAVIDPVILDREVRMINEAVNVPGVDVRDRLFIDPRAYVHRPEHARRSAESGRHHGIGATGKGCSEAVMDRIRLRGVENFTVGAFPGLDIEYNLVDTERLLNRAVDDGGRIMLEGCQGTLLDLYLGPYPFTTHKQTTPAQWMSECGLSPTIPTDIVMVVRTFPIRVAGNSGPLPRETSWPKLARDINNRRSAFGFPPIVKAESIAQFEYAVQDVTHSGKYMVPHRSDGLDMHEWHADSRQSYRAAVSEIHKEALLSLPDEVVADLKLLFEMTTVTKKLRRVAALSRDDLARATRQVRPTSIAVTFLNYVFPEWWRVGAPVSDVERAWLTENVVTPCGGVPVTLINRGPNHAHISEL